MTDKIETRIPCIKCLRVYPQDIPQIRYSDDKHQWLCEDCYWGRNKVKSALDNKYPKVVSWERRVNQGPIYGIDAKGKDIVSLTQEEVNKFNPKNWVKSTK